MNTTQKIPVAKIILERAEGMPHECVKKEFVSFFTANNQLELWGFTAPEKDNGYDKVDFEIQWEDGETYKGRFDLQKGGRESDGSNLQGHVKGMADYYMGKSKWAMESYGKEKYMELIKEHQEEAREFLEKYELE